MTNTQRKDSYIPPIRRYQMEHPRYEGCDAVSMLRHIQFDNWHRRQHSHHVSSEEGHK